MKMNEGAAFFAWSNRSRTREAPTPTNISTKSEPEIVKNGTLASPATARASSVLPVPGGPTSSTPVGIFAPSFVNFFGSFKNWTISLSSSFSSSAPATSWKVTLFAFGSLSRARDLPKFIAPFAPPDCWRNMKYISTPNSATVTRIGSHSTHHDGEAGRRVVISKRYSVGLTLRPSTSV